VCDIGAVRHRLPIVVVAIYALFYGAAWYGVWDVHQEEPGDPLAYLGVVWLTVPWIVLWLWLPLPMPAWWFVHVFAGMNAACLYLFIRQVVVPAVEAHKQHAHLPREFRWHVQTEQREWRRRHRDRS
jgi:hypothetical protein